MKGSLPHRSLSNGNPYQTKLLSYEAMLCWGGMVIHDSSTDRKTTTRDEEDDRGHSSSSMDEITLFIQGIKSHWPTSIHGRLNLCFYSQTMDVLFLDISLVAS